MTHEWPGMISLRQEMNLVKQPHIYAANCNAFGATFEAAFITGQVHFRLMLNQQGVDWKAVDARRPRIPDPGEVAYPE